MNNMIRRALITSGFAAQDIPSTYSTRHQVVADFKASGITKHEIAAFFGHSSDFTHQEYYGHKRHGGRMVTYRPSPDSLSHTTNHNTAWQREIIPQQLTTDIKEWNTARDSRESQKRSS